MKRILSIDGGGIKGVVPAAFLAQLEEALGESITHFFDLIAGTSTGGIIALGLGQKARRREARRISRRFPRPRCAISTARTRRS